MGTWSPNRAQGTSSRMIGKMMVTLALLFALSEAASITYPARNQLDINFNNFGFKFGAKFDNKVRPQDGGKVHMEVPANMVMRIIRGEPSIARQLLVPFKEEMYLVYSPSFLERLYDVVNIKMEIDYKTKQAKLGVMSVTAKYIITHHDYTEETGTLMLEGDGQNVVFQTLPSEEMFTKTVFRPMEIKLTKMQKDLSVYLPFATRKGYNFYFTWKGEAELPYVKQVSNEGLMGVGAASSSRTVFKLNNQINDHGILFSLNRDGLKYDYDFSYE